MRRRRFVPFLMLAAGGVVVGVGLGFGCSATREGSEFSGGEGGESSGPVGSTSSVTSGGDDDGGFILPDGGGSDAPPDVPTNPCGSECGPVELCDDNHIGFD